MFQNLPTLYPLKITYLEVAPKALKNPTHFHPYLLVTNIPRIYIFSLPKSEGGTQRLVRSPTTSRWDSMFQKKNCAWWDKVVDVWKGKLGSYFRIFPGWWSTKKNCPAEFGFGVFLVIFYFRIPWDERITIKNAPPPFGSQYVWSTFSGPASWPSFRQSKELVSMVVGWMVFSKRSNWATKRTLVGWVISGMKLPTYMGIITNHYKDPY